MAAQEIKAQEALELLKGWFNNKMMVVIFRIQYFHIWVKKTTPVDVREQLIFLNDVQHHYLRERHDKKTFYNAAKWLKAFFRVYPKHITTGRSKKAWKIVKIVYEGFGLRFPFNGDGTRSLPCTDYF